MKTWRITALLLAGALPAVAAEKNDPFTTFERDDGLDVATIVIDGGAPAVFSLPPTLFGTFTENIWDAIYGGVWAQLLHNPSFEPDYLSAQNVLDATRAGRLVTDPSFGSGYVRIEPVTEDPRRLLNSSNLGLPLPWEPLHSQGARYEPREGDAANSARSLLIMGLPERETGIRQGVYLPVHRTTKFMGSIWTKGVTGVAGKGVALTVSFRRRDKPDEVLAQTVLHTTSGEWRKQQFRLELPAGALAPLEKTDFCLAVQGEERLLVDNVLLSPADAEQGFDPEIIAAARAMKTPLLRFGGNFTSGYHWRDGVGDPDKRRTMLNQAWGLPEYNHFGTDEFIALCRLIGAEPQICVNAGSGEPEEAAAWVEYCNGPTSMPSGARRAANGHPEPYGVKYWEVGNELWGDFQIGWQTARSNSRRYGEFARAMRKADPTIKLIATGGDVDSFAEWNGELIEGAGERPDLLSTHLVIGMQPGEQKRRGADDAFTHAADLAVPVAVGRKLDEMRAQVQANPAARDRVKFAFTEWQFWSPRPEDPRFTNVGGAVNTAAFFHTLARRSDFVPLSNMSNLVQFAGIHRQRGRVFVTPSTHVFTLYAAAVGGSPLPVVVRSPGYDVHDGNRRLPEIPDVPYVDALAVRAPGGDELRVYLVNRSVQATLPATIEVAGFEAHQEATLTRLGGKGLMEANTPEHPRRVEPVRSLLAVHEGIVRLELPPLSVNLLTLARQKRAADSSRRRVIIITDCGAEMDDQWTIAQAALSPQLDVVGVITTHAPNLAPPAAETAARTARELLAYFPKASSSPPVIAGSSLPLANRSSPRPNAGVQSLLDASAQPGLITALVIGAATDVASALLLDPTLAQRMNVVAMAYERWPEGGDSWNVKNDIAAWQVLLDSGVPLTVGDATITRRDLSLSRQQVREMMSGCGEAGGYLARLHAAWLDRDPPFIERITGDRNTWPVWDQVVLAEVMGLTHSEEFLRPSLADDLRLVHPSEVAGAPTIRWISRLDAPSLWSAFTEALRQQKQR